MEQLAVSVDSAARSLGISRRSLFNLIARGEIRSVKIGGRRLIPVAQLHELVERGAA